MSSTTALLAASLIAVIASAQAATAAPSGAPIDEAYRQQFGTCDRTDVFGSVRFPIKRNGRTIWYGCSRDPSRFDRFESIPATATSPAAVVIVSKLGHDEDGSAAACHHQGGPTDQCTTSLMLNATASHPCLVPGGGACVPLDPDTVAYVVIPGAAPKGIESHAFSRLSRVQVGDYGVVIEGSRTIPVIVGDEGPAYKIGEGSTALLKALSANGSPRTISAGVVFVLFPGSADKRGDLSPDTIADVVRTKGQAAYDHLTHTAAPTN